MTGRWVLVTGATGHVGNIISETLAELEANLILVDQPATDLDQQKERFRSAGVVDCRSIFCDLSSPESRSKLIAEVRKEHSELNCLVNNAAFVGSSKLPGWSVTPSDQSFETWSKALELNLIAVFHICQGFAPLLRQGLGGNIINLASIYGELGPDWSIYKGTDIANPAAYSASKGGIIQLTKWLATSYAPYIRANAISPGGIFRDQPKSFVKKYSKRVPLGRMATEEDLKGVIAFLASDAASYVTGQTIRVDGGLSAW